MWESFSILIKPKILGISCMKTITLVKAEEKSIPTSIIAPLHAQQLEEISSVFHNTTWLDGCLLGSVAVVAFSYSRQKQINTLSLDLFFLDIIPAMQC